MPTTGQEELYVTCYLKLVFPPSIFPWQGDVNDALAVHIFGLGLFTVHAICKEQGATISLAIIWHNSYSTLGTSHPKCLYYNSTLGLQSAGGHMILGFLIRGNSLWLRVILYQRLTTWFGGPL